LLGGVISSRTSANATDRATNASTQAAAANNATQLQIWNQNQANTSPFINQGVQANPQVNALLASNPYQTSTGATFQADPGYEFSRNEMGRGVAQSAAFGGALRSGGALKAYQDRAGDLANQQYGQWWNRDQQQLGNNNQATGQYLNALQGQQQLGMGAASAQAGVGQNFANATSNNNWQAATNTGNAAIAGANNNNALMGNLFNAGANLYGQWQQGRGSSYSQGPIY
jgi:hypothetical protein